MHTTVVRRSRRGADLGEYGEGAWYVFLHAPCGLAAVEYQQS
ncbi:hypothetical protein ACU686_32495 [Yinghuangia aomiensis]